MLPPSVERRVAIEAAAPETWWRYVGTKGAVVAMDRFGASAPAKDLFKHFGFTADNVVRSGGVDCCRLKALGRRP